MEDSARPAVSPDRVIATLTAYQRSAALTGALDLGLFSAFGEAGPATADAIAARCAASHHFDPPTCEGLLAKVRAALAEGGRAVAVEFAPNEDRVSPAPAAAFSLVMLCCTPMGDAHTFAELDRMFRRAGFARSELHALPPSPQHAIISHR